MHLNIEIFFWINWKKLYWIFRTGSFFSDHFNLHELSHSIEWNLPKAAIAYIAYLINSAAEFTHDVTRKMRPLKMGLAVTGFAKQVDIPCKKKLHGNWLVAICNGHKERVRFCIFDRQYYNLSSSININGKNGVQRLNRIESTARSCHIGIYFVRKKP